MNKKLKLVLLSVLSVILTALPSSVFAYSIDYTYNSTRMSTPTNNKYIILHETGGYAPAVNNAIYFNREWANVQAYTSFVVGDGGKVFQVSPPGLVQWGAGSQGNTNAPAQIELARTTNKGQFLKDYPVYVNLARDMAHKYGIPLTLDSSGNGIKSHLWFTLNFWGDHTDPYGYLESMGVSKTKLANDLQTGLPENGASQPAKQEVKPTPKPMPAPSQTYESTSGVYTFTTETRIRNGVGLSGQDSGLSYSAGQSVNYDRIYKNIDGYTWLSYMSYNGTRRFVAMVSTQYTKPTQQATRVSQNGTYRVYQGINIRNTPTTNSTVVGSYSQGQTVQYDSYVDANGYRWLSYISYSGQRRFVAYRTLDNTVQYGECY